MKHTPLLIATLLLAAGCSEDGRTAEGARVLVPDNVRVEWDDRFNGEQDGLGILVPVDLMVYEGGTGEPLGLVRIDVQASAGATVIGSGTVDTHSGDCSACVWDAGRDRYVLLPGAHDDAPLLTDTDGMARVYLWIDAFPGSLEPIEVDVDTEASGATFEIHGF